MKGPGTQGHWKSTETSENNQKTKYDVNNRIPKDWDARHHGKLFKNIKQRIFDVILTNGYYTIGQHNLLKNDGIIEYDQKPHSDYPSRSRNS